MSSYLNGRCTTCFVLEICKMQWMHPECIIISMFYVNYIYIYYHFFNYVFPHMVYISNFLFPIKKINMLNQKIDSMPLNLTSSDDHITFMCEYITRTTCDGAAALCVGQTIIINPNRRREMHFALRAWLLMPWLTANKEPWLWREMGWLGWSRASCCGIYSKHV